MYFLKMDFVKMEKMAKQKDPSPRLVKMSSWWEWQNKKGNPVENGLWYVQGKRYLKFLVWTLSLLWALVFFFLKVWPFSFSTLWPFIVFGLIVVIVLTCLSFNLFEDSKSYDANHFIAAVAVMECILNKPLDEWTDNDKLEEKAIAHLTELASQVKVVEELEKEERTRVPWREPEYEKRSAPKRERFNHVCALLSTLLPISKAHGVYFAEEKPDKEPASEVAPEKVSENNA